ncbi:1-alkyl-2-acetylglycerophosphocholine esterase [Exophiala viscosa]|uniref:1-alkyl-2-acetylglycerophosphocholine esterase n=1 Tax=Exophiala viscosa TaxID=2486360 RepID=A0AAN6DLH4_9EURO|nr:1-alkyl-2-acetylglycerophosphocholine esterase [Exophiala viscosa]
MPSSAIFPDWVHGHPKNEKTKPQEVPKHKPKARPPRGMRDRIPLYGKLPRYTGPYQVGTIDLEVPAKQPRTFSDITRQKVHIIALETVLMTIYYPAQVDSMAHVDKSTVLQTFRPTWLSRPREQTSRGYAKFASLPENVALAWFLCTTWFTKLPAFKNAHIAEHWPQHGAARENHRSHERHVGNPPPGGPEKPKFPLILFSHGLGGTRTAYSSVCGEFASHGFVVVALEHRDGSGPRTLINHPDNSPASRECVEKRGNVEHFKSSKEKPYDVVDFIFPKHDRNDTTPGHTVDKELRRAQVDLRLAEIHEAYQVMQEICAGNGDKVAARNLRLKGAIGASKRGLEGIDWSTWTDRFHTQGVTMVGHSFGATTTVSLLRQREKFKYITQGIVYDIWGMAVLPPPDDPKYRLHVPLLGINSEAFMYWRENLKVATDTIQEALDEGQPAWLMTVRGTVHISQSDFCILYPHVASLVMKMTIDPVRAIDLNIDASLDFLSRIMPEQIRNEQPFMRSVVDKRLLDLEVTHSIPEEHQPDPKYMAVKLKVKHEARKRLVPGTRRRYWERLEKSREEVWLHLSPDCSKVGRCQTCVDRRTGYAELNSSQPQDEEEVGDWENIVDEPKSTSNALVS